MAQVKAGSSDETSQSTTSTTTTDTLEMPVASINLLCEESNPETGTKELVVEEEESCQDHTTTSTSDSTSCSLILPNAEDNLSIASPDSGHGTTGSQSDGQSEHEVVLLQQQQPHQMEVTDFTSTNAAPAAGMMGAILNEPGMLPLPRAGGVDYSWINGPQQQQQQLHQQHHRQQQQQQQQHLHQTRVMEPMAINTETGFTTVLVDASAMAGYPHHVPAASPWPPHHHHPGYGHPHHHHPHHHHHHHHHVIPTGHFQSQQHPHPPPHFLHPHAYHDPLAGHDYGGYIAGGGGYDSTLLSAPPYDPAAVIFDPSAMHLGGNGGPHLTAFGAAKVGGSGGGRNHRAGRGSSVSPKRPNHRSVSQNNSGQPQRRASGQAPNSSSSGGRYTPSPSSGRSRGSSPGQPTLINSNNNGMNNNNSSSSNNPSSVNNASANPPMVILHSGSSATCPPPPSTPGQHVVHLHVNPGETVSLQMGGQVQVIQGPATVRMVSTGSPPVPLPVQVPPGHVLQQIVDERGTLRHVILSPAPAAAAAAAAAAAVAAAAGHPTTASSAVPAAPVGVLPLATPSHPPPPPPHYGSTHGPPPTTSTTTTPPHFYGSNGTHATGAGGYHPPTYGNNGGPPSLINHTRPPHSQHQHHQHHQHHHHQHQHQHPAHGFNMSSAAATANAPNVKGPSPPSPPSPVNYQSERLQRQSAKLRKKLESRSNKTGPGNVSSSVNPNPVETPPSSPKKDNNNIRKLKDRNQNGMPELGSPAGQDQTDSVKKNDQVSLAERITELAAPQVSDVESRSANVSWTAVEPVIVESAESTEVKTLVMDISYEAVIGLKTAKSASSQDKSCYRGKECHFRLTDLQPGTDYWIRVSALVDQIKVRDAPLVEFRTDACPPDTPLPPKLQNRSRNNLVLRWSPPADNGSPIIHYILECDDGAGNDQYSEAYRGRNKQFAISKLQSSTCYAIRLAACNEIGISGWSQVLRATTMGAPPAAPAPPTLRSASAKQINLTWGPPSLADMLYTLQMADPDSGHGFLNVYHGVDIEYTCTGLTRSTAYRFRLQAQNDDGLSRWSDETTLSTTADRPAAPARPSVKGRIQSHSFRLRWDPPLDSGGASVSQYSLELDSGAGFMPLWSGTETELTCDKLTPGTTYRIRISCFNGQEHSDFSETLIVTTEPVCPGAPAAPRLVGKAKSSHLQLEWERPEYDGGSMVTQYEVNMINPDGSSRIAFSGYETECLVASLLPGRIYAFQVRASNRIGFGPWSELFEIKSGPGVPSVPAQPSTTNRSAHSVSLVWNEPANNGSIVTEYRLEMAHHPRVTKSSSAGSLNDATVVDLQSNNTEEAADLEHLTFMPCHSGPAKQYEVKSLHPWTTYHFRVQAVNAIGLSGYSPVASVTTLASSPASVSGLRCASMTATSLSLCWNAPHCNGSPITHYNVEIGDRGTFPTSDASTSFDVNYLTADTTYRVRVQAANAIGVGPFSTAFKFNTRPLPPDAPRLECVQASHNSLKLRWADGKNLDFINYFVEMQEEGSDKFYLVYEGTSHNYKVSKLRESAAYTFRICARNEVGEGPYSDEVVFSTTRAPPPTIKKPEVLDLTETSCRIVWSAYRSPVPSDSVTYVVEVTRAKEQEPVVMRRCSESETAIDGLEARSEYSVRVCPIRLCQDGEIPGAYSPSKTFTTPSNQVLSTIDSKPSSSSQMADKLLKPLGDQYVVLFYSAIFTIISFIIAVIINHYSTK